MRKRPTSSERLVWRLLRNRRLVAKFRRQHRLVRFILDFHCPDLRLGLEIDGAPHLTEAGRLRDEKRTRAKTPETPETPKTPKTPKTPRTIHPPSR